MSRAHRTPSLHLDSIKYAEQGVGFVEEEPEKLAHVVIVTCSGESVDPEAVPAEPVGLIKLFENAVRFRFASLNWDYSPRQPFTLGGGSD